MVNQKRFEILIQILSLKIYDEKRNEKISNRFLDFYITREEKKFNALFDKELQESISRIKELRKEASATYRRILKDNPLNVKNENHIKVLIEVVYQFQDYSFVRSHKTAKQLKEILNQSIDNIVNDREVTLRFASRAYKQRRSSE